MSRVIFICSSVLTIAWLAVISWWISTTPIDETKACESFRAFCALRELPLNAIGDLVAGSFSVLAFLWLVTAVMLQGIELQRQHKEMVSSNARLLEQSKHLELQNTILVRAERRLEIEALVSSICRDLVTFFPKKIVVNGGLETKEILTKKFVANISDHDVVGFLRFAEGVHNSVVTETLAGGKIQTHSAVDGSVYLLHTLRLRLRDLDVLCADHAEERSRQVMIASGLLSGVLALLSQVPR